MGFRLADIAQALIAAAMLSLLLYPTLAGAMLPRSTPSARAPKQGDVERAIGSAGSGEPCAFPSR